MASEDALREAIRHLTKLGVSQKVLAAEMDVSETWLSRWLKNQGDVGGIRLSSVDAFARYVHKLRKGLDAAARISITEVNQEGSKSRAGPLEPGPSRGKSARSN